ncbi:hypothetical protein HMPREF0621_1156, partial [Pasteurella dagmatis ATCC 43325]
MRAPSAVFFMSFIYSFLCFSFILLFCDLLLAFVIFFLFFFLPKEKK